MKRSKSKEADVASTGMVFDIKRYAIHDGPGIRTTVFLKGCLLNCPWCHNPEGKAREQEFIWWKERCIRCRDCENACTKGVISFSDDVWLLDKAKCDLCGACADACHSEALKLAGKKMGVAQVIEEIGKDIPFYDESGGGVTLSGGEPLLQPDFSADLLKACKKLGIRTTVDTCGHAGSEVLSKISKHTDLFLYDLKVINDDKHTKFTGVSNKLILENLKTLSDGGPKTVVRFPLIPGVNDDEIDILELGEFVSSLNNMRELSILPYHKAGAEKSKRLIRSADSFFIYQTPPAETLREIEEKLKGFGLEIQIGGS